MAELSLLTDKDLISFICHNNKKIQKILNDDPFNMYKHRDEIEKLFNINILYYQEAIRRDLRVPDFSFMLAVATFLGKSVDNLKDIKIRKKLTKKR